MGLLTAVEQWVKRDLEAEWKEWEGWLDHIASEVSQFPSVTPAIAQPETRADMTPRLSSEWDPSKLGIAPADVQSQLESGEPRIELNSSDRGVSIRAYTMEPGEDEIIARRLREVLQAATLHQGGR